MLPSSSGGKCVCKNCVKLRAWRRCGDPITLEALGHVSIASLVSLLCFSLTCRRPRNSVMFQLRRLLLCCNHASIPTLPRLCWCFNLRPIRFSLAHGVSPQRVKSTTINSRSATHVLSTHENTRPRTPSFCRCAASVTMPLRPAKHQSPAPCTFDTPFNTSVFVGKFG